MDLTITDLRYLLYLAESNKREGEYYGRRDHFNKRQDKVIDALKREIEKTIKAN